MANKLIDRRNMDFVLNEMLHVETLTQKEKFEDHSPETFKMALDAAYQLATEVIWPTYQEFDREGVSLDGKNVTVPESMHAIWKAAKEGGWFAPSASYDNGGQQFPNTIFLATGLMMNAANTAAMMYIVGTAGAAELLESFGSEELKAKLMPSLFAGEWGGTMALTEPQAGSSLADIKSTATKVEGTDYYLISGTKRFISSGDHNLAENIIHPTLAKIDGAPDGVKGISLFMVPKNRINDDGSTGEWNDVTTASLEHKMGLKGQATAELIFGENDECRGYLLGEPHKGMLYMFQLMNTARLNTGIQAISQASAAYYAALQYANEREQGREVGNRDSSSPMVTIIHHPSVRRMLLTQKAYTEGCISLLLYAGFLSDSMEGASPEERDAFLGTLELLTPVCKAYVSEVAYESISSSLQCFGGSGYIEEFPVAQMLRDNRVFPIYEGTNDIQALDLLARKVVANNGAYFQLLLGKMNATIAEAREHDALTAMTDSVEEAVGQLAQVTMHLGTVGMSGDTNAFISFAPPYLRVFSQAVVAWLFLWQSTVAQKALNEGTTEEDFYCSKLATAKHYINIVLPTSKALIEQITDGERTALDFKEEWFV